MTRWTGHGSAGTDLPDDGPAREERRQQILEAWQPADAEARLSPLPVFLLGVTTALGVVALANAWWSLAIAALLGLVFAETWRRSEADS